MKKVKEIKRLIKRRVPTKETIKCDICGETISTKDRCFFGYTTDTKGLYAIDTYMSFHACSCDCLQKKIKEYSESCRKYEFSEPMIEFTLINGG